jgi:hypothetical protein
MDKRKVLLGSETMPVRDTQGHSIKWLGSYYSFPREEDTKMETLLLLIGVILLIAVGAIHSRLGKIQIALDQIKAEMKIL